MAGVEAAGLLGAAVLAGVEGALLPGASVVVPAEAVGATQMTGLWPLQTGVRCTEVELGGQPDSHSVQLVTIGRKAAVPDKSQPPDMLAPTNCKADRPDVVGAGRAVPGGPSAGAGSGAAAGEGFLHVVEAAVLGRAGPPP